MYNIFFCSSLAVPTPTIGHLQDLQDRELHKVNTITYMGGGIHTFFVCYLATYSNFLECMASGKTCYNRIPLKPIGNTDNKCYNPQTEQHEHALFVLHFFRCLNTASDKSLGTRLCFNVFIVNRVAANEKKTGSHPSHQPHPTVTQH